jgi:hypothetical protein
VFLHHPLRESKEGSLAILGLSDHLPRLNKKERSASHKEQEGKIRQRKREADGVTSSNL